MVESSDSDDAINRLEDEDSDSDCSSVIADQKSRSPVTAAPKNVTPVDVPGGIEVPIEKLRRDQKSLLYKPVPSQYKEISGYYYGTCKKELLRIHDAGKIPIIECDTMGAISINKTGLEGNYLFIYPPSFEELRTRIGNRIETEEEFKKRIE